MQKKQNGRSMIEMLGVLAIIAMLSIGGLLGYRRAVNNHQANTILDDANRLAFVIMENDRAYEADDFMEEELIDSVPHTGTYNLDAFMAGESQFGIVVTNVPRGVCESLVPKAAVEYKVRVMPGSEEKYLVPQMANIGIVYDSFHKDICNDTNDVVLYFGDTSGQCNKPDEGEDYTKCLSNADCCGGAFCAFENPINYCDEDKGIGKCKLVTSISSQSKTINGQEWIRSTEGINWWSAKNWCEAQGKKLPSRADIGCEGVLGYCIDPNTTASGFIPARYGSVLNMLQTQNPSWTDYYHWLEDKGNCAAFEVHFYISLVTYTGKNGDVSEGKQTIYQQALCH